MNENKENLVLQAVVKHHPSREQPCQGLHQGDRARRMQFCQWFIGQSDADPDFIKKVLWSDENRFRNCGMFNRKKPHYRLDQSPHLHRETREQVKFGFNIWIGTVNASIVDSILIMKT